MFTHILDCDICTRNDPLDPLHGSITHAHVHVWPVVTITTNYMAIYMYACVCALPADIHVAAYGMSEIVVLL